jgi:hypothetical protein
MPFSAARPAITRSLSLGIRNPDGWLWISMSGASVSSPDFPRCRASTAPRSPGPGPPSCPPCPSRQASPGQRPRYPRPRLFPT